MGSPGDEEEEDVATAYQAKKIDNGLSMNGLQNNGLSMNGLSMNGLSMNGLSMNGLSMNGAVMSLLSDPVSGDESRKILAYATSCALTSEQGFSLEINGVPHPFAGGLGLAPEWGGDGALDPGSCGANCQAWVSSCILSRVNAAGQTIPISVRGPSEALETDEQEREGFPTMEAAYYGDLFSNPPTFFACTARGSNLIERVCGSDLEACAVDIVGDCDDVFLLGGNSTARCGIADTGEGYYPDCRDDAGTTYPGTMTVFRQCGNGVCDQTESNLSCPEDCP